MKNKEKTDAMKPFDDRFADKVREVFDQHQEAFDPGAWAMMQRRLSSKKKPVFIALWPYLSRAAVVLLIVGGMAWLFMKYMPGNDNMLATTMDKSPASRTENRQLQTEEQSLEDEPMASITPHTSAPGNIQTASRISEQQDTPGTSNISASKDMPGISHTSGSKDMPGQALPSDQTNEKAPGDGPQTTISVNGLTSLPMGVDIGQVIGGQATDPSYPDYVPEPPGGTIAKSENKAFTWSVMAGSMMTYAEQQLADGLGFSGGFLSEWKVSPLIRISSGLVLAYQQFDVSGMPLRQKMSRSDMYYAPENYSVQTLANHEYEILAFDIPVNIHFQLAESHKSKWFVTAGFSSLLYLQQHVTGQETAYVEALVNDQFGDTSRTLSYASEVSINASYDAFQRFDFGRLLNLSFGYEIRGERRATIIEPFIKYPLGTVSSREIKMGMGGVSLRYRFGN
jgi:hypothetical protein